MIRSWTGNIKEAKSSAMAPYGLSDDARMLSFRRRSGPLANTYNVKSTVTLNKCSSFNNNTSTVYLFGVYKFPFNVEKSEALIMSVLQEMPAQETDEMCQYFQTHPVQP